MCYVVGKQVKLYDGHFIRGKKHGPGTMFFPTGQIKFEGGFENDRCHGAGKEYRVDGTVRRVGDWRQGRELSTSPAPTK